MSYRKVALTAKDVDRRFRLLCVASLEGSILEAWEGKLQRAAMPLCASRWPHLSMAVKWQRSLFIFFSSLLVKIKVFAETTLFSIADFLSLKKLENKKESFQFCNIFNLWTSLISGSMELKSRRMAGRSRVESTNLVNSKNYSQGCSGLNEWMNLGSQRVC